MTGYSDSRLQGLWVARRDAEAFSELVSRHAGMVYGACRRVLRDAVEAEDVTQECFLALARHRRTIEPSVGGWLYVCGTRLAIDRLRSLRRRLNREIEYTHTSPRTCESTWDEVSCLVDEAVADLPEKLRAPLVAHFMERQSYDEVSARYGLARSTAVNRVNRGLELVRIALRRRGVAMPVAALGAALDALQADAVSPTLCASLGKMAIAGSAGSAMAGAAAMGGIIMVKKMTIVAMLLIIGALGVWQWLSYRAEPSELPRQTPQPGDRIAPITGPKSHVSASNSTLTGSMNIQAPAGEGGISPAPAGSDPNEKIEGPAASIWGRVINESREPLEAVVEIQVCSDVNGLLPELVLRTMSGADGEFSFSEIKDFNYPFVYASAGGYMKGSVSQVSSDKPLKPGEERGPLTIVLKRGAYTVGGRVVDEGRLPIPGAVVNLVHTRDECKANFSRLAFEVTDDQGRFEMAWSEQADCDFIVTKEGYGPGFFPRVATGTTDAEFVLRKSAGIEGTVTWDDGTPAAGAWVRVLGCANSRTGLGGAIMPDYMHPAPITVYADAAGNYRASGLGGDFTYTIWARDPAALDATYPEKDETVFPQFLNRMREKFREPELQDDSVQTGVKVHPGAVTSGVDLVLSGAAAIEGVVTDEGTGAPAYPVLVTVAREDAEPGRPYNSPQSVCVSTDESGRYRAAVELGERTAMRVYYSYIYFGGGHGSATQAPDGSMELAPGEKRQFDFQVPGPVTVHARFVDERGAPRSDVVASIRKDPYSGRGQSGAKQVEPDGTVTLMGLRPNIEFQVLACEQHPDTSSNSSTVGESEVLTGAPGETLPEVTVVCTTQSDLIGTLVDSTGFAVSSRLVMVTMQSQSGESGGTEFDTWEDGRFELNSALGPGTWTGIYFLLKSSRGLELAVAEHVTAKPGERVDLGVLTSAPVDPARAVALFSPDDVSFVEKFGFK